jgi:tRNA(fMet)-specific endonuclease VapC
MHGSSPRDLLLPSIVAYELNYGALKNSSARRKANMEMLLRTLDQAPFDEAAAMEAARIRIELEKRGNPIGHLDLMIAATATSRGAVLVTNNTREFSRVKGLALEDWNL